MDPAQQADVIGRATGGLFDKGVLGIFCLFLIYVAVHLYRALRSEVKERMEESKATAKANAEEGRASAKAHAEEIKALNALHTAELKAVVEECRDQMQVFYERHAAKAETWASLGGDMTAKFNTSFDKFVSVTEALARRGVKPSQQP